jgi:nucleoside-diphosphate-sugar epimerase
MKRLLIAGCGDLGIRLAATLDADQWQVTGLRRNADVLPDGISAVGANLLKPETLKAVAAHWDGLVYQATPGERSPAGYRQAYVEGLANILEQTRPDRLIFVSSTAVYGQDQGQWVDEDSETVPAAFNGRVMLEAERLALAAGASVVRFSGIYGPGRDYLLRLVGSGQARCRAEPPQWTNRIHADDCARVLAHVLDHDNPAPVYCASDSMPVSRCDVLGWLAEQLKVAAPARDDEGAGQGKRVSNQRLLASGYDFLYPDFKSGYGAMLT